MNHWEVLGLAPGSPARAVLAARRRLAKAAHPDVGGSAAAMQAVNAAAEAALAELARPRRPHPEPGRPTAPAGGPPGDLRRRRPGPARVDHPSFVVEATPAVAFEWLSVAAAELGDLVDADAPVRLEVALGGDARGWCELMLVADAGATTVSLAVAGEPGSPAPDVELVRDLWIDALNAQ